MKSTLLAACVTVMTTIGTANVFAAPITPDADAMVSKATPDLNQGSANVLQVRGNASTNLKSYLRFSLSSVSEISEISSLSLTMAPAFSGGSAGTWVNQSVFVYGLLDSVWDESTITWNNAPSNTTSSVSGFSPAVTLGSFNAFGTTGAYSHTISGAALTELIQGATSSSTLTFMLGTTGTSPQYFGSDENTNASLRPFLEVTVPEPAALALMGLSVGMLCVRRRRA